MSLGIFESTMAYLETIFEFFDFGHSKPLFQLQNEVVSTIHAQYGDKAIGPIRPLPLSDAVFLD